MGNSLIVSEVDEHPPLWENCFQYIRSTKCCRLKNKVPISSFTSAFTINEISCFSFRRCWKSYPVWYGTLSSSEFHKPNNHYIFIAYSSKGNKFIPNWAFKICLMLTHFKNRLVFTTAFFTFGWHRNPKINIFLNSISLDWVGPLPFKWSCLLLKG